MDYNKEIDTLLGPYKRLILKNILQIDLFRTRNKMYLYIYRLNLDKSELEKQLGNYFTHKLG